MKANLLRILSLALCMALLLGLAPMVQLIPTASAAAPSAKGDCGEDHSEYTPLGKEGETTTLDAAGVADLADGGDFILMGDIVLPDIVQLAVSATAREAIHLHIDLNGYTVSIVKDANFIKTTGQAKVAANEETGTPEKPAVYATLTICDSSESGTGTLDAGGKSSPVINMSVYSYFNFYGGTITGVINNKTTYKGGGVYVNASTAHFNMYGGAIWNNSAITGGGVHLQAGRFDMWGGEISENIATGETVADGHGGGGIYANSTLYIRGGKISNNEAKLYGGGIRKQSSAVLIMGGSITNNTAKQGGGIWVNGNHGTYKGIQISGGQILGNTSSTSAGGGIGSAGSTQMVVSGGTIVGNTANGTSNSFYVGKNGSLNISNAVVCDAYSLHATGATATIGDLSYGARILAPAAATVNSTNVKTTPLASGTQYSYNASADEIKHNLSLESEIDFRFFVDYTNEKVAGKSGLTATITHTLTDGTTVTTDHLPWEIYKDTNYYYFSYDGVDSKQMTEELKLEIKNGDEVILEDVCTVKDYANQIIADNIADANETALVALMERVLDYGAAAQMYFEYNTENLATAAPTAIAVYPAQEDGYNNLSLESEIDFRFMVDKSDEKMADTTGLTATITHTLTNGSTVVRENLPFDTYINPETGEETNFYYFSYDGVDSKQMTEKMKLVIKDAAGAEVYSAESSVQEYAQRMLSKTTSTDALKVLMTALLEYGSAAQQYFNYNTGNLAAGNNG